MWKEKRSRNNRACKPSHSCLCIQVCNIQTNDVTLVLCSLLLSRLITLAYLWSFYFNMVLKGSVLGYIYFWYVFHFISTIWSQTDFKKHLTKIANKVQLYQLPQSWIILKQYEHLLMLCDVGNYIFPQCPHNLYVFYIYFYSSSMIKTVRIVMLGYNRDLTTHERHTFHQWASLIH